jgi:hypothetical protein
MVEFLFLLLIMVVLPLFVIGCGIGFALWIVGSLGPDEHYRH